MDFPPDSALLEARLIREIASVDRQIHEMQTQRRTLEMLLLKARREGVAARAITRRNSVARILIEDAILDALKISKTALHSRELYRAAVARDPTLKDVTFRSYIHRLAKRGSINPVRGRRGVWTIADHTKEPSEKPDTSE